MANIKLNYDEIDRVCNVLNTSVEETLVPRMNEAQQEVDALLETGLVFVEASPALQAQYQTFTTSLKNATQSIIDYANQFQAIKESMQEMDADMAEKVKSSGR
ncbi:hypothetical protein GCM10027160_05110 [Streptomyces calidiresistens]|uniref:TIGR04197 family type VII secretion effector n=2 Tax=Streptomyces TaxID=1883 RepID=A0A7W3TH67_9ACTN|nr:MULTISPECIES: hypothetical protein [Streptomyces]MBB0232546.1 hypothetical protein [Streptomyces calidiresistens]MBB0246692.1 hypothetical protein [Streptomyces alkaliphilus]MQS09778.1 hypothetical protein [Streptomyces alkaliphilus]